MGQLRSMLVEDKSSGTDLIQTLKLPPHSIPIKPVERVKDKYTRLLDILTYIEAGLVSLPKNAPWLNDYLTECESFSADDTHPHDDQVDVLIDAVTEMLAAKSVADLWSKMNG
jgi:predicted phage terminase large subunit-like protein